MDYQPMLHAHEQSGADLTVAVRRVNPHETHRYGIVTVGSDDRIIEFREKPRRSLETLASMGIYVFRREVLVEMLQNGDYVDFGKHVLPAMIKQARSVRLLPRLLGRRRHGPGLLGSKHEPVVRGSCPQPI